MQLIPPSFMMEFASWLENDTPVPGYIRFALTMRTVLNSRAREPHERAHRHWVVTDPVRLGHVVPEYEGRGEDSLSPRTR